MVKSPRLSQSPIYQSQSLLQVWLNFIVHFQTTNKHIEQSGGVAGQCRAPLVTNLTGKRLISGLDATLVWMPAAELLNVFFIK